MRVLPSANAASRMCAGHRLQPVAGGREDRRQREQRHHRAGRDERAPVHAAAFGGERERREQRELEDRQPEDRDHDVGRAGDDLDARLDHARQPARTPVLGDPHGAARAPAAARARCRSRSAAAVPSSGSRKPPEPAWSALDLRAAEDQARAQVLDAAVAHVEDDRGRDHAQPDARGPREQRARAGRPSASSSARSAARARPARSLAAREPRGHRRRVARACSSACLVLAQRAA